MGRSNTAAKKLPPTTVAERRRQLREKAGPAVAKADKRIEIDLSKPDARKALAALFPRPENDTLIEASPELEAAALRYIEARDAAAVAAEKQAVAGNELCHAIAKNLGVTGVGWKATWDLAKGSVDWTALAKELAISDETIARHRKPSSRTLIVRETADSDG